VAASANDRQMVGMGGKAMADPVSFWPADFAGWAEAIRNSGLVLGGIGAFGVAAWALHLNRLRTRNDGKRLEADRNRLVNDTYVKAVEQLGHNAMEVRLGAIYALERIAATDRDYHWPIMETLCAYVRERPSSQWERSAVVGGAHEGGRPEDVSPDVKAASDETAKPPPGETGQDTDAITPRIRPPTDIHAILTVFRRRSEERKEMEAAGNLRLDFRHVDWQRADLTGADLTGAHLTGADLTGAKFLNPPHELGAKWDEADPPIGLDKIEL
jgi:hypothetical protein